MSHGSEVKVSQTNLPSQGSGGHVSAAMSQHCVVAWRHPLDWIRWCPPGQGKGHSNARAQRRAGPRSRTVPSGQLLRFWRWRWHQQGEGGTVLVRARRRSQSAAQGNAAAMNNVASTLPSHQHCTGQTWHCRHSWQESDSPRDEMGSQGSSSGRSRRRSSHRRPPERRCVSSCIVCGKAGGKLSHCAKCKIMRCKSSTMFSIFTMHGFTKLMHSVSSRLSHIHHFFRNHHCECARLWKRLPVGALECGA